MSHHENYLDKQLREKEEDQRLYEQTIEQLRTEERFVNFFKGYNADSVDSFINYYAQQKVFWHRHKGNYAAYAKQKLQDKRNEVVDLFKHIMEKKVFNLQCSWVAGEMDLEGIENTLQFVDWCNNPVIQKAAGPITADEFYCYLHWYEIGSPERLDEYGDVQGSGSCAIQWFHRFKSNYHDNYMEYIPEWFHEYDRHFGTGQMHLLSTLRRDMEEDLLDSWSREVFRPSLPPEQQKNLHFCDRATRKRVSEDPVFAKEYVEERERSFLEQEASRPKYEHLSVYDSKLMDKVVSAIESREVQKSYRLSRRWEEINEDDHVLFRELLYLNEVKEYVAVNPHDNYVQSIEEAYEQHHRSTMHQALQLLWEEYDACQRNGLSFDWGSPSRASGSIEERRRILEIRKLKGLPANFDFMKKENLP